MAIGGEHDVFGHLSALVKRETTRFELVRVEIFRSPFGDRHSVDAVERLDEEFVDFFNVQTVAATLGVRGAEGVHRHRALDGVLCGFTFKARGLQHVVGVDE